MRTAICKRLGCETPIFAFSHCRDVVVEVTRAGVSFGAVLAIAISWSLHQSVLWAIFHGILSWVYVLYYVVTR